jgi:hypothetical protein
MFRKGALLLLFAICLGMSANAFNGERKGFVLGGGLGIVPVVTWEFDDGDLHVDELRAGFGSQLIIGYAWDEHNMIVYEANGVRYKSSELKVDIIQGFSGVSYYRYWGPKGKSAFFMGGLGIYLFSPEYFSQNDPGFGLLIGGGYEFTSHWQLGGYLSLGRTTDPGSQKVDFKHSQLTVLISTVAF